VGDRHAERALAHAYSILTTAGFRIARVPGGQAGTDVIRRLNETLDIAAEVLIHPLRRRKRAT
jgi:hypothetical protein